MTVAGLLPEVVGKGYILCGRAIDRLTPPVNEKTLVVELNHVTTSYSILNRLVLRHVKSQRTDEVNEECLESPSVTGLCGSCPDNGSVKVIGVQGFLDVSVCLVKSD